MSKKQKNEDPKPEDGLVPGTGEETPPQKSADIPPSEDGKLENYVSKESYQGLQRVVAKKDQEKLDLQKKLEDLSTKFEELKADSSSITEVKGDLETQLQEAQSALTALETDRSELDIKLKQQGIIMQEFPELASMAEFIPAAEDEDTFRNNAQNLQDALGGYVKKGVAQTLEGGSPPQDPPAVGLRESEEDQLWEDIYRLAGSSSPDEVKEYREKYDRLQEILAAKQTT